jgi:two-component sensor histidine kinase
MTAIARDGRERFFGVAPLTRDGATIVAALSASSSRSIGFQLAISFFVPLLTLIVLAVGFSRTLKTGVIDWVIRLDEVARVSAAGGWARATISRSAPLELDNVARSLNDLLDARKARETELSQALTHNRYLTRELHHRVKNSLQLVQSYLALGAREAKPEAKQALTAAQCRAYILSSAYRRALAEGEIRPFEIDPFLSDVAAYAAAALGQGRLVEMRFDTGAWGGIDEAIPLGVIVVELIELGVRLSHAGRVTVSVSATGFDGQALILAGAEGVQSLPPQSKLLKGLLAQIRATPRPPPEGSLFAAAAPMPTPSTYSPQSFV